ncbi:MAG: hypothetical protein AAB654_07290 [Acidobacteriota bacterium]
MTQPKVKLLRPAEYARERGLAKSTISRQIAAGKITLRPDGLLDPQQADLDRKRSLDPLRGRRKPEPALGLDELLAGLTPGWDQAAVEVNEGAVLERLRQYTGSVSGSLAAILDWFVFESKCAPHYVLPGLLDKPGTAAPAIESAAGALLAALESEPPTAAGGMQ